MSSQNTILNYKRKKLLFKIAKILAGFMLFILGGMFLIPKIFGEQINTVMRTQINNSVTTSVDFSNSQLSFFKHFPSLTFSFYDFKVEPSMPFEDNTLMSADELYFKINPFKLLFSNDIKISSVAVNNANIKFLVDNFGNTNYNIYNTQDTINDANKNLLLEINRFEINNSQLLFDDATTKIFLQAQNLNVKGDGSVLSYDVFLDTFIEADDFKFSYDNTTYFVQKFLNARIKTKFNTEALTFNFDQNIVKINQLPIQFEGDFSLHNDGYMVDFIAGFDSVKLEHFISALPSKYNTWMEETDIKGQAKAALHFKGIQSSESNTSPDLSLNLKVDNGSINCIRTKEFIENINIAGNFLLPGLDFNQSEIDISNFSFKVENENLSGRYLEINSADGKYIDSDVTGQIHLENISYALGVPNLYFDGDMDVHLISKGLYNPELSKFPKTEGIFKVVNGIIETPYYPNPITDLNIDMSINNASGTFSDAQFLIHNLNFVFENEPFNATASFINFEDLNYNIKANGIFKLDRFYQLIGGAVSEADGSIAANIDLQGTHSNVVNGQYQLLNHSGSLSFNNISAQISAYPKPFLIETGELLFSNNTTRVSNFKTKYGSSNLDFSGNFTNLLSYLFYTNQHLDGQLSLSTNHLNLNEFIPSFSYRDSEAYNPIFVDTTSTLQYGVFKIPPKLNLHTTINAAHVVYDSINIHNTRANVLLKDEALLVSSANITLIDAPAQMSGSYKALSNTKAQFSYKIKVRDFDINRAYRELPLFREMVPAAAYTQGIARLDYQISGILDGNMQPILPALEGSGDLYIHKGKIRGYNLLGNISRSSDTDAFEAPELNEITIPTRIKDNILTIDRFRIRSKGFRLRTEGETSLDGDLNLRMRVGLPPFGIIGIPITVTGTSDEPKISLGRRSPDLETVTYEDYLKMKEDTVNFKTLDSLVLKELNTKFRQEMEFSKQETDSIMQVIEDYQLKPTDSLPLPEQ